MTTVLLVVVFKCEQDKERADFAQGAYCAYATKQKRKRKMDYIKAGVAFKCEQDKAHEHRRRERTLAYATKQKRKRKMDYIKADVAFKCEQDKERADFAQGAY